MAFIGIPQDQAEVTNNLSPVENNIGTDQVLALKDGSSEDSEIQSFKPNELIAFVQGKFSRAKTLRRWDENRWLAAYNNFRGLYGNDTQFTDREKSQAFIKITKTKVQAAVSQIQEILFAGNRFPIGVEPSPVPEGVAESVHLDLKAPDTASQPPAAAVNRPGILELLGGLKKTLDPVKDKLKEGPGKTPTAQTWEPAKEAAKEMDKLIQDQLSASSADKHLRSFVFEQCLLGTGVFKGPFAVDKEKPKWTEKGEYQPLKETIAEVSQVSVWDSYPDPDARNMDEVEYFIQRHRLNRSQLRALSKRPYFRNEAIEKVIFTGASYQREYWEDSIEDDTTHSGNMDRWEVLEFWGIVDKHLAEEQGLKFPEDLEGEQVQINAWVCQNELLRVVLNPFTPIRIPYYICPYELNPYSIFGVGVAENMLDTQLIMNGFFRLMVDNAVLSSNVMLEVDRNFLVPGQSLEFYPGKIFERNGGMPGQSVIPIKIDNITQECLLVFDKARQLADEATGMPSYSHGMSGVMGVGRTASGMSMLMGAAKENIKSVIRNIDDYLLVPLGKAMFAFNMQFNHDEKYNGDVEIVARGTESLMRNEIRSQKLLQFLQIASNPMDAPYVKRDYLLRELAASLDLEPDKVVNDPREAAIQAAMMQQMGQVMGPEMMGALAGGSAGNPSAAPSANDPTGSGGGNMGPGQAPAPGQAGFTGGGGGDNGGQPSRGKSQ